MVVVASIGVSLVAIAIDLVVVVVVVVVVIVVVVVVFAQKRHEHKLKKHTKEIAVHLPSQTATKVLLYAPCKSAYIQTSRQKHEHLTVSKRINECVQLPGSLAKQQQQEQEL